jgi:hypothetical protein
MGKRGLGGEGDQLVSYRLVVRLSTGDLSGRGYNQCFI